jgi:hypothetical protein
MLCFRVSLKGKGKNKARLARELCALMHPTCFTFIPMDRICTELHEVIIKAYLAYNATAPCTQVKSETYLRTDEIVSLFLNLRKRLV